MKKRKSKSSGRNFYQAGVRIDPKTGEMVVKFSRALFSSDEYTGELVNNSAWPVTNVFLKRLVEAAKTKGVRICVDYPKLSSKLA